MAKQTIGHARVPDYKNVNKQSKDQVAAQALAPKPPDPKSGVLFKGVGIMLYTLWVDDPTAPNGKRKKDYHVDFGSYFQYRAYDKELIAAMRKDGYKEA